MIEAGKPDPTVLFHGRYSRGVWHVLFGQTYPAIRTSEAFLHQPNSAVPWTFKFRLFNNYIILIVISTRPIGVRGVFLQGGGYFPAQHFAGLLQLCRGANAGLWYSSKGGVGQILAQHWFKLSGPAHLCIKVYRVRCGSPGPGYCRKLLTQNLIETWKSPGISRIPSKNTDTKLDWNLKKPYFFHRFLIVKEKTQ